MPLHANVNRNFWWNEFLLRPLLASDDNREFVLPVMCGYVGHLATALPFTRLAGIDRLNTSNGTSKDSRPTSPLSDTTDVEMEVDILLISRIHRQRVGTRYTRRGLDDMGFAANFVETELVVMTEKDVASFVQARGSVPWLWQQETDLSYKPAIELEVGVALMCQCCLQ